MAHNVKYSTALKNSRLDQITSKIGASGLLRIYSGTQPANPDIAVTSQVKLLEFTGDATAFAGAASGGVLTANAIADATALASGTASWFRLCKDDGTPAVDGTVGISGTDCIIDNISITAGQSMPVISLTITSAN
ncbi:MAG TPA: hypothetical protein VGM72_05285 [Micropepsaceae bacterium]|jgi:hypothetical protein